MEERPAPIADRVARWTCDALALAAGAYGVLALVGHATHLPALLPWSLRPAEPGFELDMILAAAALLCLPGGSPEHRAPWTGQAFAVALVLWATTQLTVGPWLAHGAPTATATVCALALGLALVGEARHRAIAEFLAAVVLVISYVGVFMVAAGIPFPPATEGAGSTADRVLFHMPVLFLGGLAVLLLRPRAGRVGQLLRGTPGGLFLARLVLLALVGPPAWVIGQDWIARHGVYDLPYGHIAVVAAVAALALLVVCLDAIHIDRVDDERRAAQAASARHEAALARSRELEVLKDRMLSMFSHEIKTPLAAIQGFAELLEDGPDARALAGVQGACRRLATTADQILTYNALVGGHLPLRRAAVDPGELARAALACVEPRREEREVQLELALTAGTPPVWADAHRVVQVLTSLLDNALKATPPGGRCGLAIAPDAATAGVRFEVWDQGSGLQPETLERLWRAPDGIANEPARATGLGFGLAIARQLVALHGGTLVALSHPGQGTRLLVTLPAATAATGTRG